ncbi:hypothetical protein ACLKMH_18740 [Psychromonas sp. KJ10-10]|uniref:hypothetical protein n=1 Tax=Psychromonas sp. KJ10-10 TaxID=3391823 RepID=UPI0039B4E67D
MEDKNIVSQQRYPAYLDFVRRQLQRDYDKQDLSTNGLSIFTHFDPLIQMSAEKSLEVFYLSTKTSQIARCSGDNTT